MSGGKRGHGFIWTRGSPRRARGKWGFWGSFLRSKKFVPKMGQKHKGLSMLGFSAQPPPPQGEGVPVEPPPRIQLLGQLSSHAICSVQGFWETLNPRNPDCNAARRTFIGLRILVGVLQEGGVVTSLLCILKRASRNDRYSTCGGGGAALEGEAGTV